MNRRVITVTLNPVVDKNTMVEGFVPDRKLWCSKPVYYAGGGGINVSRAIRKLGGTSTAIYMAGGRAGKHLKMLLDEKGIEQKIVHLKNSTRENLSVMDSRTQLQYRFGLPGPNIMEAEWKNALAVIDKHVRKGDYLVASGKLPPGVPDDFYFRVGSLVHEKKAKFILDTKGQALTNAIRTPIFLLKPNLSELCTLGGVDSVSSLELEQLAKKIIKSHACSTMVVSLGSRGALLVTNDMLKYIPAPVVEQKSAIGAGDSMVAGMVVSLLKGKSLIEMTKYGVACGAAATLRPGTQLCQKNDVDQICGWIKSNC